MEVAANERTRLVALKSYDILDTPSEEVFDEFARLAASIRIAHSPNLRG
jgi:hypothetical protein